MATAVSGQTATDYFHQGAQLYIANKKNESKKVVETGLGLYPQDPLLNGMAGLLKKEEEKQQQQQQSQQGQNDQQKQQQDQQKEDQQGQQQQQQDQQKQDQQSAQNQQQQQDKQQQQQQESQQGQQDQQPQPQQGQDKDQQGQQQSAAQGREGEKNEGTPAGQMTPQEARQLLDSRKQDEKALPANPANNKAGRTRNRPVKDW